MEITVLEVCVKKKKKERKENNTHVLIIILSLEGSPTTHHPPGPVQPNAGAGRCVTAQVSGVRGPGAHGHLEKKWSQSGRKGPAVFPAGARQPTDPEHQGRLQ